MTVRVRQANSNITRRRMGRGVGAHRHPRSHTFPPAIAAVVTRDGQAGLNLR